MGLIVGLYSYSLFLYARSLLDFHTYELTLNLFYRPTIIAGLGFSGGAAQLHTVPPYVPAVVLTSE